MPFVVSFRRCETYITIICLSSLFSLSVSVHSSHCRSCFAALACGKLESLRDQCCSSLQEWQSPHIQVATMAVEPRCTGRLKIAQTGQLEENEPRLHWLAEQLLWPGMMTLQSLPWPVLVAEVLQTNFAAIFLFPLQLSSLACQTRQQPKRYIYMYAQKHISLWLSTHWTQKPFACYWRGLPFRAA